MGAKYFHVRLNLYQNKLESLYLARFDSNKLFVSDAKSESK